MMDAQKLAKLLAPTTTKDQISLGTVTAVGTTQVSFVLDGEDPTSLDVRTAATFTSLDLTSVAVGARITVARVNASYVVLGVLR